MNLGFVVCFFFWGEGWGGGGDHISFWIFIGYIFFSAYLVYEFEFFSFFFLVVKSL